MKTVYTDLVRFSSFVPPINLSFNQYLLLTNEPVLVHTGSYQGAKDLIPELKEALSGKDLSYIFVSHFESDECGGLSVILEAFPGAKVICSEVTARQFGGFGMDAECIVKKGGDSLKGDGFEFEFITYPSEMHLWDGLLLIEKNRKIYFSSDLVFRMGEAHEESIKGDIKAEIQNISDEQLASPAKKQVLIDELLSKDIRFIAAGHGDCVEGN